jgi:hypothetical protein
MKGTACRLALLVLLAQTFGPGRVARAQPATPAEEAPAIPPASADVLPPPPPPPPPAPPAEPSTPVDASPPTRVHTPPAVSPPLPSQPSPSPPPAPQLGPRDAPRFRDAHHDRVLLLPTAETHPAGTFYVSDYEIVVAQLGYALTDHTQLTLTGAPPLGVDRIVPLDLTLKTVILREPTVSVALLGSVSGIFGIPEINGVVGRAGGAVSWCQPAWTCRVSFTFSSNLTLLGPASVVISGVGFVFRFDERFALLAELATAVPLGPVVGRVNGAAGGAGIRFSGRRFGLDLGLIQLGKAGEPRPPLLPLLVFSWRSTR